MNASFEKKKKESKLALPLPLPLPPQNLEKTENLDRKKWGKT